MLRRSEAFPAPRPPRRRVAPAGAALSPDHPCAGCGVRLETFCGVLEADALARFKAMGTTGRAAPRQCLFHEGDSAAFVYNLTRGTVKLYTLMPDGRRQIAGFVFPGDFIGLSVQNENDFTAEVIEPAEYCRFTRARFMRFLGTHRGLARELYLSATHDLATARSQMAVLGRKRAPERLASFLLELAARLTGGGEAGESVSMRMTRTDIADYLGLTKETVSRAFTALRRSGLVAVKHKQVALLDPARLAQLARGEGG